MSPLLKFFKSLKTTDTSFKNSIIEKIKIIVHLNCKKNKIFSLIVDLAIVMRKKSRFRFYVSN
ncbi:hypothetical protein BpHYR1_025384 [Brachionus plicatilis]|uniref:Uncharacterized protein n=1 Tax=Brachionus plicatilis TaxID=10195 RepID=A0A3M7PM25_BRAPC|nr:hypothetical protein BpHYR1_025384 [Brachionus plicatilis]